MNCIVCNCPNEICFKEICNKNEQYIGFICMQCSVTKNYCNTCEKIHDKIDFINNICIYRFPGYILLKKKLDDLLSYLCNSQIIPNTLL